MEKVPPIPAVEEIKNPTLRHIGELSRNPELEALDAADTSAEGLPLMLFVVIGMVLLAAAMMVLLFLTQGNQVVTTTLGNHFMR